MYTCKYVTIKELIYPDLYNELESKGKTNNAWLVFDPLLLFSIDLIRDFIDSPIIINKYPHAIESGLREFDTKTGASLSMHKFGKAADLKFNGKWTPEKLRSHMEKIGCFKDGFKTKVPPINQTGLLKEARKCNSNLVDFLHKYLGSKIERDAIPFVFLTRIEWLYRNDKDKTMSWFHMDLSNSINDFIQIVQ